MFKIEEEKLKQAGIFEHGIISTSDIRFLPEIRKICEGNSCRSYASCWACPPAVGSFEQCTEKVLSYDKAFVFTSIYRLKSSFDIKGMKEGMGEFKKVCDALYELIKNELDDFLLLSNEGCRRCEKCTYPDKPCRFPDRLFPSIEGFGIYVSALAECAGVKYNNGPNNVTYFGAVLFNNNQAEPLK